MRLKSIRCLRVTGVFILLLLTPLLSVKGSDFSVFQEERITGVVFDAFTNETLVGVNIIIKGTTTGVVSDIDGKFSLPVSEKEVTLRFSFIGYVSEEITIESGSNVEIQLVPTVEQLEGIVVIGYGTQKERNVTGSVGHMRSEDITDMAVTSLDQTMQGRMAGVVITQNSAAPGGSVTVRVRGATSGTSNEPLYVIDGVPVYNDNSLSAVVSPSGGGQPQNVLASLNPSDIESITVLKDASATSIYGSRGANGVVLIQTRRGKSGETRVALETYFGIQTIAKRYDLLNASQFAELSNEAARAVNAPIYMGGDPYFSEVPAFSDLEYIQRRIGDGTDWQNEILQAAPVQNYQLSITSGSERGNYALMAGVYDQSGIIKSSDFRRYSLRVNNNFSINSRIDFGSSVSVTRSNSNLIPSDGMEGTGAMITPALSYLPLISPYREDGSITAGAPAYFAHMRNPIAPIDVNEMNTRNNRVIGSMFTDVELPFNFTYRLNLGFDYNENSGNLFAPGLIRNGFDNENTGKSLLTIEENMWLLENTLRFQPEISELHSLEVLAGYSAQEFHREWVYMSRKNFPFLSLNTFAGSIEIDNTSSGSYSEYALQSMFSRVNYDYMGKYLVAITVRRDGSSRFGRNNRHGVFPAFSVGWRLSDESFMDNYSSIFNNIMVRYSYGISGNQEIGNYNASAQLYSEVGYSFSGHKPELGAWPMTAANPDLGWEETAQSNLGADIGILNDRYEFSIDLYRKVTSDVLVLMRPKLLMGYADPYWNNAGVIENTGIEMLLSGRIVSTQDFRWLSDLNFSANRNRVVSFPQGEDGFIMLSPFNGRAGLTFMENGQPLGNFYGYRTDGIFMNQDEVDEHVNENGVPVQPFARPGDIRYVDVNGDGKISSEDRTVIGNAMPGFILGFTNRVTWKRFGASAFIYAQTGNEIFNMTRYYLEGMLGDRNQTANTLNRWRSDEDPGDGVTPRATRVDNNKNWQLYSDRWIEDGSFIRLRNVTFSYNLPAAILERMNISNCKLSLTGQNIITLTRYSGFDPEVSSNAQSAYFPGYDQGAYPMAKSFVLSIGINF